MRLWAPRPHQSGAWCVALEVEPDSLGPRRVEGPSAAAAMLSGISAVAPWSVWPDCGSTDSVRISSGGLEVTSRTPIEGTWQVRWAEQGSDVREGGSDDPLRALVVCARQVPTPNLTRALQRQFEQVTAASPRVEGLALGPPVARSGVVRIWKVRPHGDQYALPVQVRGWGDEPVLWLASSPLDAWLAAYRLWGLVMITALAFAEEEPGPADIPVVSENSWGSLDVQDCFIDLPVSVGSAVAQLRVWSPVQLVVDEGTGTLAVPWELEPLVPRSYTLGEQGQGVFLVLRETDKWRRGAYPARRSPWSGSSEA